MKTNSTFWGRPVNPRFNAYRKRKAQEILGLTHTFAMITTEDSTGNMTKISFDNKDTITSLLKTRNYLKIDNDNYIGDKDFVHIYRESWR